MYFNIYIYLALMLFAAVCHGYVLVFLCSHFLTSLQVAWYVHIYAILKILFNNSEGCVILYIHHAYASASPISAHKCMSNLVSHTCQGCQGEKTVFYNPGKRDFSHF